MGKDDIWELGWENRYRRLSHCTGTQVNEVICCLG